MADSRSSKPLSPLFVAIWITGFVLIISLFVIRFVTKGPSDNPPTSDETHPVVFIGLDGASWEMIDPMIEAGELPTFERLRTEGSSGPLRSVDCYFSPPAWVSMVSGFSPYKHGVYTFGARLGNTANFRSVSALDVAVPRVWDVASAFGRRVAVTNVPVTYPAQEVNGIMVTGFMTPFGFDRRERTIPGRLAPLRGGFDPSLDGTSFSTPRVGTFVLDGSSIVIALYDTTDDSTSNHELAAMKIFPSNEDHKPSDDSPIVTFVMGTYSPWIQVAARDDRDGGGGFRRVSCSVKLEVRGARGNLHVTPLFRLPSDPDVFLTYPKSLGSEIEDEFGHYLIALGMDSEIIPQGTAELANFATYFYDYDKWDLFFYVFNSPDNIHHREGFSVRAKKVYQTIDRFLADLLKKMPEDVTLVIASDHGFARYDYVIDLNKYFESLGLLKQSRILEYDRSIVFHDQWCIYFNDDLVTADELRKRGIEVSDAETPREALIAYLKAKGREITNPETGNPMPVEFVDVPQDGAGNPPDMVVIGAYSDYCVEGDDLHIRAETVVRRTDPRTEWFHHRNGIYLLWGDRIRSGVDGGLRDIEDITPTILYLLDLPLAADFDGEVMRDIIRSEYATRQPTVIENYADLKPDVDYTYEELEALEDKLRALGYIR